MSTKIQWTDESWNPIIGCSEISDGCKDCYAKKMAFRLMHMPHTGYYQYVLSDNGEDNPEKYKNLPKWNGNTHFVESQLEKPLKRKKPTKFFVCSMGDLFHGAVPFYWIDKVMAVILKCPQHTFQILTKRPEIMESYFKDLNKRFSNYERTNPPKNLWLGVTAENQYQADKRIPILARIPAKVRFVSCEPLLGYIDLEYPERYYPDGPQMCCSGSECGCMGQPTEAPVIHHLDWIIAGPETGSKSARIMNMEWIESLHGQCVSARVPFFDKKNSLKLDLTQMP